MSADVLNASGKERALANFYAQLKRDGMTATALARRAGVGRAYLSRVLNCDTSGRNTWKHVLPVLSEQALFHLKQCSAWNEHAENTLRNMRETLSPLCQTKQ